MKTRIEDHLPEENAGQVPMDLLGLITGLSAGTVQISWNGPEVRIIEHQAHAPSHAALLIKECGVLVAGDMLSDVLVPMLDFDGTADPIGDYLTALGLIEAVVGDVASAVPGYGTVAKAGEIQGRIDLDRAYVIALRDGRDLNDPRIGASAKSGIGRSRSDQWPARCPVRRSCRSALGSFRPMIWTVLPLRSYLVVMASNDATVEASQMWDLERSMTICSGSLT